MESLESFMDSTKSPFALETMDCFGLCPRNDDSYTVFARRFIAEAIHHITCITSEAKQSTRITIRFCGILKYWHLQRDSANQQKQYDSNIF